MLRKIIKALIPNRGEVFFELFVKAAENVHQTSNLLADIINAKNTHDSDELVSQLRMQRQKAVDINKEIIVQLNEQFITPIDRGDIFHLSGILLKLTKRIIKINKKLQLYAIGVEMDDCLLRSVDTLQQITKSLYHLMIAFKDKDEKKIKLESQKASELDENVVEDLGHALEKIKEAQYDTLTVIKLKEVYKAIESAVDTSATLCDSVMRIYVKEI
ncbi:DUF47 domain-containing protein [Facilibium subflavum]|uniref:DUF47 domain-containing protein n=1 Tax=Facilibium subflavum TaxID=2219058 RepID=UPI000E65B237|nr:DUF47 family protein [Facilibium subflavum]